VGGGRAVAFEWAIRIRKSDWEGSGGGRGTPRLAVAAASSDCCF